MATAKPWSAVFAGTVTVRLAHYYYVFSQHAPYHDMTGPTSYAMSTCSSLNSCGTVCGPLYSYICHRPTTVVLSTLNNTDFIYTCATHLTDAGFASPIAPTTPTPTTPDSAKPKLSDAEIKKIAEEWEAKQKLKKEKEKAESKDKDAASESDAKKPTPPPPAPIPVPTSTSPSTPAPPSHPQFALHRQIFAMRQNEARKKRQAAQVKQVAPKLLGLPSVPRGGAGAGAS